MHMLDKMASLKKENAELIVENKELQVGLINQACDSSLFSLKLLPASCNNCTQGQLHL